MAGTIGRARGNKLWSVRKAREFNQDWSSEEEVYDLLFGFVRALKPENILEIGTFEGDTALAMSNALKDNELGHLTTTDIRDFGQEKFLTDNGVGEYATCVYHNPIEYLNTLPPKSFDFIFIDGRHEYEDVTRDLEISDKLLTIHGYIIGHDVISFPSVRSAYETFLNKNKNRYHNMILDTYAGVFVLKKIYG